MFKRAIIAAMFTLGTMLSVAAPASAAVVTVKNGDFKGATNTTVDPIGGPVQTPFGVGNGAYTGNFAWSASGCACNNAIASYPNLIAALFAPPAPAGYLGNVYLADANPYYAGGVFLQQTIGNLTAGSRYTVSFLQASGNKYLTIGDTVHWDVGFGGAVTSVYPYNYLNGATIQSTTEMVSDGTGSTPWTRQSVTFTARDTSQLLSFFANGNGAPPYALLADVSIAAVPEPATWAMMILGFGVVGGAMRAAKRRSDEKFDAKIKRIAGGEAA